MRSITAWKGGVGWCWRVVSFKPRRRTPLGNWSVSQLMGGTNQTPMSTITQQQRAPVSARFPTALQRPHHTQPVSPRPPLATLPPNLLPRTLRSATTAAPRLLPALRAASLARPPQLAQLQSFTDSATLQFSDSSAESAEPELTPAELQRSARLAHLSGLCYGPQETLQERLAKEGLQLVAQGVTHFTRWYIADGPVESADAATGSTPNGRAARERLVMMRGVVWQGSQLEVARLWQQLLRFWPAPFAEADTRPAGALVAHAGIAAMAQELYEDLQPHLLVPAGTRLQFGGHSLGGSLAVLLCGLARLRGQLPASCLQCTTFGSPPVLAHATGTGAQALQVLGLPPDALRHFVLASDPIPRAMLSADPWFTAAKGLRPVAGLLQLRAWLLGPAAPLTPSRFLLTPLGRVYLVTWGAEAGQQVVGLAEDAAEAGLAVPEGWGPAALAQALLDHHHGSYSQELAAAARQAAAAAAAAAAGG